MRASYLTTNSAIIENETDNKHAYLGAGWITGGCYYFPRRKVSTRQSLYHLQTKTAACSCYHYRSAVFKHTGHGMNLQSFQHSGVSKPTVKTEVGQRQRLSRADDAL